MIIWPIHRFWTFTPWQWLVACLWNVSEVTHIRLPNGVDSWAFETIMGMKGKIKESTDGKHKED